MFIPAKTALCFQKIPQIDHRFPPKLSNLMELNILKHSLKINILKKNLKLEQKIQFQQVLSKFIEYIVNFFNDPPKII